DDHLFCDGVEGCSPGAAGADSHGCVPATVTNPCTTGQTCDETMRRCVTTSCDNPDADADRHRPLDCGRDDCDDEDPNRYPGNHEVCDATGHDEDCDSGTFGFRDDDGDGDPDQRCCNTGAGGVMTCGTDCNDMRPGVSSTATETCDMLDNDCDGM